MWFSVSEQLWVTLYSLIMGVFLGFVYDIIRIVRSASGVGNYSSFSIKLSKIKLPFLSVPCDKKKKNLSRIFSFILIFISDLLFALICSVSYSLFLFHTIRGQVRLYFILASGIGFLVYRFTASKFLITILECVLFISKTILRYVFKLISLPFLLIAVFIKKLLSLVKARILSPFFEKLRYRRARSYTIRIKSRLCTDIRFDI